MKKIMIVPDSFKGTLSSFEVCEIGKNTITSLKPDWEVETIPMADGGEGTLDAYIGALEGAGISCRRIGVKVTAPDFSRINASFGLIERDDKKEAIVELAQASGLTLISVKKRDPMFTTSFGTGELIKKAARSGTETITVGIGGSATNDGGVGMSAALGVKFYDKDKKMIPLNGGGLSKLTDIDISGIDKAVSENKIIIASDVTNTLCGKNGATYVFGFQKGATEKTAPILEENMMRYAEIIKRDVGVDVLGLAGGGAAGGVGTALMAFFGGKMRSGAELLLEAAEFSKRAVNADFVITGEGKLDSQSLGGKLPAKVAELCQKSGGKAKMIAVAGVVELDENELREGGFSAAFRTSYGDREMSEIIKTCREDLKNAFIKAVEYMDA